MPPISRRRPSSHLIKHWFLCYTPSSAERLQRIGRPVKAQDLNRAAVVPGVFFPVLAAAPSQEQKAAVVTMLKERYENDDETKESDMGRGADEAAGQR